MKLIYLLACIAVAVRSGPLPACLWDEVIESWDSTTESPVSDQVALATANRTQFVRLTGNDTPEDVARDRDLQQSMGHLQKSHTSLQDQASEAKALPFVHCLPMSEILWTVPTAFVSFRLALEPINTPPRNQYHPLLI